MFRKRYTIVVHLGYSAIPNNTSNVTVKPDVDGRLILSGFFRMWAGVVAGAY
jgi:hypothetical protein